MNIRYPFEISSSVPLRNFLGQPTHRDSEYLLVSGLFLEKISHAVKANKSNVFLLALNDGNEANEALNSISAWMKTYDVMNQHTIHGDNRYDYNITFARLPAGGNPYLSVVNNFFLTDYVFDHNHPEDAGHFDDLMRMLDRDKMAGAMLDSLKNDFGMKVREEAPLYFRRDMRQCSHPDYRRFAEQPASEPVLLRA